MNRASNSPALGWEERQHHLLMQPFALAVSQSAIPTVMADTGLDDVPIVFANASFLRLTGWEQHEVLGRNLRFLNGEGTDPDVAAGVEAAVAARETVSVDIHLDRRDGPGFWARLDLAPVFGPDGQATLLFGTLVDVSDRVAATDDLRDAHARFEARVEERTEALETALEQTELLSREITHRTKNALAILSALIEAKRRGARDAWEADLLADISRRVRAIASLQGMLDGVESEGTGIELDAFLSSLVAELGAWADADLTLAGAPSVQIMPEAALALALCVTELVLNAQKHAFAGRPPGHIRVAASRRGEGITLSVSDDGKGLPDGFVPEHSHGLGMLVVRDQTRKLGGVTTCGPSADGGASFEISFPV